MLVRKCLVEFLGVFFLVLTIAMTVLEPGGAGAMAPLAIGAALMCMVYAGGHVSGAHYNPAVTLAVVLRGKCPPGDAFPYVVVQILGALAAAFLALYLKGDTTTIVAKPLVMLPALLSELLFTFALCWVVLHVATAKATSGNSYYGLAIGFIVLAGAYAVGPISGGAFNPAVAVGLAAMGVLRWADIWIHVAGEVAGALLAAVAFKFVVMDRT